MAKTLFLCVFLALPCVALESYTPQKADPVLEPWRFRHEEALAGFGVLCMDEAPDGTLYFGGTEGLVRYDGFEAVPIPYGDGLMGEIQAYNSKPWTKAILALDKGGVLALVGDSLVLWSEERSAVIIRDVGFSNSDCKLARAPDGAIWLIARGGLWRISPDLEQVVLVESASSPDYLSAFCFDEAGDLWFVKRVEGEAARLNHIPLEEGLPAARSLWGEYAVPARTQSWPSSIAPGRDGLIWFGERSIVSGLEAFDSVSGQWVEQDHDRQPIPVYSLMAGSDGSVWGGVVGSLCRIDPEGRLIIYTRRQLLLPKVSYSLYETSDHRIWAIGHVGIVYSIDVSEEEWLTYERLNLQCETVDRVQWYIEKSGAVVSHDPEAGEWLQYGLEDGLIDAPEVLVASSHGLIWAAGMHEGGAAIAVYDGSAWTRFLHHDFAQQIEGNSVFEAADGTMWFGAGGRYLGQSEAAGGVLQYEVLEGGEPRLRAHHGRPLVPYFVFSAAETSDAFWLGSEVVLGYDAAVTERRFALEDPRNYTVDMLVDQGGTLWVAKEQLGIFQRRSDGWRKFGTEDGLASPLVADLLLLRDGSLLAASEKGISRFDGASWTAPRYLEHFGMAKRWSGMRETVDGALWFNFASIGWRSEEAEEADANPTQEAFRVTRHRPETISPETRITEYVARVSQPGNCRVEWIAGDPWGHSLKEDMQYSWRLNGGDWSEFRFETGHTFLDLNHGRYVLEVRSRDQAFNMDPTPERIEFSVVPPLWMQPWFVTMVVSFVGMILFLIWVIVRNRERHLREQQIERERSLVREQEERETYLLEQQKERERHLLAQQEERERHHLEMDRLKTGFFTNVSHELRTPLTVILGPLRNLLREERDEAKKGLLALMERNANRVAVLVSQLLDFRSLEQDMIRIEATEGDLAAFLEDVVASLLPLAEGNRVSCRLLDCMPCRGWFDPDKLQKIVTNLLSNAFKYTPAGGEVRVEFRVEEEDRSLRWAVLVIEDTGSGIEEEHREHIFERFYRVPEQRAVAGSGIGLNLTYELVELWGGTIDVESPIHEDPEHPGSRFTVRLPIDREGLPLDALVPSEEARFDPSNPSPPLEEVESSSSSSLLDAEDSADASLVLVVEDNEDIRSFISGGLESSYRIEVAVNGREGLEKARELSPDLVITDLMMPDKSGLELCRELKAEMETCHIPVIMLTAKSSLDSQLDGLEAGADDYVTKPFHMVLLKTRILNLLESRRKLRQLYGRQLDDSLELSEVPESDALVVSSPGEGLDQAFIGKVRGILQERVSDPEFDVERLAEALNMSPRTLRRKVKALTDRSPVRLIIELRLKKAVLLLQDPSIPVTEIAYAVGYGDSGHFTKQFRAEYGMSPSAYREQQK